MDTDKITTLIDTNPLSDSQRNPGNSWYVGRCGISYRRQLCEQNGCVPHKLSDRNLQQRLDACDLLLEKKEHLIWRRWSLETKSGLSTITTHIFAHLRKITRVFLGCFASLHIVLTLRHRIIIASALFKIFLINFLEKIFQIRMKIYLEWFLAEKPKTFWEKVILDLLNRWAKVDQKVHTLFNKDLYVQIYLNPHLRQKMARTFWPTQYIDRIMALPKKCQKVINQNGIH